MQFTIGVEVSLNSHHICSNTFFAWLIMYVHNGLHFTCVIYDFSQSASNGMIPFATPFLTGWKESCACTIVVVLSSPDSYFTSG
jgi:hypothetical protein